MANKKSEYYISINAQQAITTTKALEEKLKALRAAYGQLVAAHKEGSDKAKQMARDMRDLEAVIKQNKVEYELISKVMENLSGSTLGQLQRALRNVKKEMSHVSEDSGAEILRQKYDAISRQIKVMQGEYVNMKKVLKDLSSTTDATLQKAIEQQKAVLSGISKENSAYESQRAILTALATEQASRNRATISSGTASADSLRTARKGLVQYRDMLGDGGIIPTSGTTEENITRINQLLSVADERLNAISTKGKEVELTTEQLAQDAQLMAIDPKKFTPEEIQNKLKAIDERLKTIKGNDPFRAQLNKSAQQLKAALAGLEHEAVDVDDVLKRMKTGKVSFDELDRAAKKLESELRLINQNETEYITKSKQLQQVRSQIEKNTLSVKQHSSAWQTTLRNMSAYFGSFQLFSMAIQKVQAFFRLNLKFSDQLADIRKVSGLAMSEINDLANSLAKLDTRTTIQELNEIAYAGAKLGMGKYGTAGLEQFVRAANQVNVALKEDLGADALTALSKITEVMGLIPKMGVEKSMLAVGSAMFQLSATSTATSGNIVEFSKRLTGMARTAGITTDQLLALGSAADAMYLMPEVASTAFNKLITSLQTKHNLIEKELQIEPGTINNLYSAGKTMDAIVLILEKMKEKGNMNALQGVFKDLGSEGARLVNVMVTMSKNVDMLKDHLYTSKEAFEEATAVSNEYAIQQQTANALMERASNIWEKAFINPEGVDTVKELAKAWYDLSKSMTSNQVSMTLLKGTFAILVESMRGLLYFLPAILTGLMFKGVAAAVTGVATSIGLMGKASVLATLQTNGLVAAWKALNVAQKANVIGLAITLLMGLATVIADVVKKGKDMDEWMKGFNTSLSDFNREYAIAEDRLKRYRKAIDSAKQGSKEHEAAIKNFNREFRPYLKNLLDEKSTAEDVAKAYEEVVKQLKNKIALQLKEKDIEKQVDPRIGWAADRLSEFDALNGGEYNGTWLKGFVEDAQAAGKTVEQINNELASKFGVGSEIAADAYKMRSKTSPTEWFDVEGYTRDLRLSNATDAASAAGAAQGARRNNTRALTQGERMLYAATRYASQQYSATNAMNQVNRKWKPFEDNLNTFVPDEDNGTLDQDARDKAEEARRKAEEAARRKALRAEMRDEQQKAKAIIDNVKNYYERQIAAITEMATNTGMSEEWQTKMVDGMTNRMNQALAEVRKAISGTENDWATFRKSMIADLYEPLGDDGTNESTQLLDNIVHNDINQLKAMIVTLSKELGQNGSVLLDQIWRKATENQLANIKAQNKQFQARQKVLLEKDYTGKVNRDYENQMEQLGIAELTSQQSKDLMLWSQQNDQDKIREFVTQRSNMWQEAFLQAREHMVEIFAADVSTEDGQKAMLTLLFGENYEEVLSGSALESMLNMNLDQWQVFYHKLMDMSDAYADAQKKAYDEAKRRADFLFELRPDIQGIDNTEMGLSVGQRAQNRVGDNLSVGQQMGLKSNFGPDANGVEQDPELMLLRLKATRAALYYEEMARLREKDKISEEQLTEAKRQMMEAQMNMQDKLADKIKERAQLLQSFTEPIATFAEGVGEYLGNMLSETEDTNVKMKDLAKDMLKSMVKMTIKLMAEELTRMVTKEIYRKEDEANELMHQQMLLNTIITFGTLMNTAQATIDTTRLTEKSAADTAELTTEVSKTSAEVPLGIAQGAAKTIGSLGWWGIPLIAVISALLMGLLSWAISAAFGSSDSKSDSGPNVKLASGMLTYDSGNVQAFRGVEDGKTYPVVGNDGKVYAAKDGGKLETGLVKDPITTLVNGQPALVAEKGPEMVIGRETTAAMMMARPDLLAEIVKFDKNRSGQTYRAYDSGNVQEIATASIGSADGNALSSADIAALRSSLDGFAAVMTLIQKNGLHVNKYGRGGVVDSAASGAAFMRKNSGDRLWKG